VLFEIHPKRFQPTFFVGVIGEDGTVVKLFAIGDSWNPILQSLPELHTFLGRKPIFMSQHTRVVFGGGVATHILPQGCGR